MGNISNQINCLHSSGCGCQTHKRIEELHKQNLHVIAELSKANAEMTKDQEKIDGIISHLQRIGVELEKLRAQTM